MTRVVKSVLVRAREPMMTQRERRKNECDGTTTTTTKKKKTRMSGMAPTL